MKSLKVDGDASHDHSTLIGIKRGDGCSPSPPRVSPDKTGNGEGIPEKGAVVRDKHNGHVRGRVADEVVGYR